VTDRQCLRELTEAVEQFFAGHHEGDVLGRMRSAAARSRVALDLCPPDAEMSGRAAYAAGAASTATPPPRE
jgi:hypothetical protein